MFCEEYKRLYFEWESAHGQWIYYRLTARDRPAGITEARYRETIQRAKDQVDEMKKQLIRHSGNCQICGAEDDKERCAG
jgi:hypothetical protein